MPVADEDLDLGGMGGMPGMPGMGGLPGMGGPGGMDFEAVSIFIRSELVKGRLANRLCLSFR